MMDYEDLVEQEMGRVQHDVLVDHILQSEQIADLAYAMVEGYDELDHGALVQEILHHVQICMEYIQQERFRLAEIAATDCQMAGVGVRIGGRWEDCEL